jgi:hypothetical protein
MSDGVRKYWVLILLPIFVLLSAFSRPDWGFYGHRKINRMATFTLPTELFAFYKPHLEFITEHAVDPDKRRYALKNEAYRHYIDVDHWDTIPFPSVPRDLSQASLQYATLLCINNKDTSDVTSLLDDKELFYQDHIQLDRYSLEVVLNSDVASYLSSPNEIKCTQFIYENKFVKYGVLPYFLEDFYHRLVRSFTNKNVKAILRLSADMGHYIGDAHVPLHTSENYNGQMTDQVGIHAFWESRIPELSADEHYDMLVGKADYIDNKREYFWDIIIESHKLLPDVLRLEKELRATFPEDRQFCYDERLERTTWTQCPEFAQAYEKSLGGSIERRMQESIKAIGDVWLSAWVDAGQPDLSEAGLGLDPDFMKKEKEELDKAYQSGNINGRSHQ